MLKYNIKVFLLFVFIILFFILLKNGQIFDLGIVFRSWLVPNSSINGLLHEPTDLAEAYKNLLVDNSKLQTLADENEELRGLLDFKNNTGYSLVVANIINRDPINNNLIIINTGKNAGIKEGQAVVVNNGIIVGQIIEVNSDSAKVRLLTDNFSKLGVMVNNTTKTVGLLTGSLGLSMNLEYIPNELDIKKGDLIITSDTDIDIPSGLIVGQVEDIIFSEEDVFKVGSVSPLINYNTLTRLAVITSL